MATQQDQKNDDNTLYPAFCAIQNDWELSLSDMKSNIPGSPVQSNFWISLIKHNINQQNRSFIDANVNILNNDKIINTQLNINNNNNNNNNLNWNIEILSLNNKKNEYYASITSLSYNLNKYKLIPSYHDVNKTVSSPNIKIGINSIDIAQSSQFKKYFIAAGLNNGKINIIDANKSKLKFICTEHKGSITCCKFFPFGDLILSGDTKSILNIYAVADNKGKPAVSFKGHMGDITCIDFVGNGSQILSGATDNTVRLWNCSDQKEVLKFGQLGLSQINKISLINNDKILVSSSSDGKLIFYDLTSGNVITHIQNVNGSFETHCMLNDNIIINGCDNGKCYIYDIRKLNDINNKMNYICCIQRDERLIGDIIKCNNNKQNEIILYNFEGNIWKWKFDINKYIDINQVKTTQEWTGNDKFGINSVAIKKVNNIDNKLFVATKNYQIKEYEML